MSDVLTKPLRNDLMEFFRINEDGENIPTWPTGNTLSCQGELLKQLPVEAEACALTNQLIPVIPRDANNRLPRTPPDEMAAFLSVFSPTIPSILPHG